MKGFVPTPDYIVDIMVSKLFSDGTPKPRDKILDPGCGTGAFIEGIIRWCKNNNAELPQLIGIESDPRHISETQKKFNHYASIEIREEDFLIAQKDCYDYIICNPPYIPITKLSESEKSTYKSLFVTAHNRFDLYQLFFEQAICSLKTNGHLVFITPEKYLYVDSASTLRVLIGKRQIRELYLINEQAFGDLTTYPMITTLVNRSSKNYTKVTLRNGNKVNVKLPQTGESWLPIIHGIKNSRNDVTLADISRRVSCGVATGADSIFIKKTEKLDPELKRFAYPTISGKQLTVGNNNFKIEDSIIMPYTKNGKLIPETNLGYLKNYLSLPHNLDYLIKRTCVSKKPWYAFHETPPLLDILRPKILCKDITSKPYFWVDKDGSIVPRHSTYYIIPNNPDQIEQLCEYLNSKEVYTWLEANCQRAANGFIRLQSNILKRIPINKNAYRPINIIRPKAICITRKSKQNILPV